MHSVIRALERVVRQHEPFPATVMDRHWTVLMTNDAAPRFFDCFIDMAVRTGPRNMLQLIFDPQAMRPFVANWDTVSRSLRLQCMFPADDETEARHRQLLAAHSKGHGAGG